MSVPRLPRLLAPAPRGAAIALTAAVGGAAALAPATSAQEAPPAKPPHVIRLDDDGWVRRLGPVSTVTRRPSLPGAYRAFGRPTSSSGRGNLRRVRWRGAGVSILGATFGLCRARTTCRTTELFIQTARVTGPRWQTAEGLRVGDPAARIPELYPRRKAPGDGSGDVVVASTLSPYTDGTPIPIVTARVRGGVVSGFDVWVGDAGD